MKIRKPALYMSIENELKEFERIDDLHRKGYRLIQNTNSFCFGIDAVLLSDFTKVKKNEIAVDFCCGNGIIPVLLCARYSGKKFYGLEIQQDMVELANRSVKLNELVDKIEVFCGDVKKAGDFFQKASVDVITVNPPYMNVGGGIISNHSKMAIARHEILLSLADVITAARLLLKQGGRFYMVHKPHRLADIITLMRSNSIEPKALRFVHSTTEKPPSMVLVEGVYMGGPMLTVHRPLIIYGKDGQYTDEIKNIYWLE